MLNRLLEGRILWRQKWMACGYVRVVLILVRVRASFNIVPKCGEGTLGSLGIPTVLNGTDGEAHLAYFTIQI